jgi:hypothetical protein
MAQPAVVRCRILVGHQEATTLDRFARLWRLLPGPALGAGLGYLLWLPRDAAACRLYRTAQATPTGPLRVDTGNHWACTNLLGLDMWGSIDGGRLAPIAGALALAIIGLLLSATHLARTE